MEKMADEIVKSWENSWNNIKWEKTVAYTHAG